MKALTLLTACLLIFICSCQTENTTKSEEVKETANFYGYPTKEKWGEHLVMVGGCGDCHTPKKMSDLGPIQDSSLLFAGHPAQMPPPPINMKDVMANGLAVTQSLTAWVGPWGTSYAGNISSDSTGIGMWTEAQFAKAIKGGKYKGLDNSRPIMPPMPIESFMHFTDEEVSAIFAYLKTTPPQKNVVPAWQPPPPPPPPAKP